MDTKTTDWLKSGDYLPPPLRDFHNQKELFKGIHDIIDVDSHEYAGAVNWRAGHCYVIDIFLWFMARRGYTLQRSRARLPFRDLHKDLAESRERRISQALPSSPQPTTKERT